MAKILITVPTGDGWCRTEVAQVLTKILYESSNEHEIKISFPVHKPVENNMHHCMKMFFQEGHDFWLSMDSDNPPLRNPLELVKLDLDLVGCPTPMWTFVDDEGENYRPIQLNAGDYYPPTKRYKEHYPRSGLQQVDAIGAGCFLMHKRVAQSPILRKEGWVRRLDPEWGTVVRGLDYAFCERARKQGFKVYCHYDYPCLHFKEIELTEIFRAFGQWRKAVDAQRDLLFKPPGSVRGAVVFPIWATEESEFLPQRAAFESWRKVWNGRIMVVDDGCLYPTMQSYFREQDCDYVGLTPHAGLTRSWNEGARRLFDAGNDVVVLGNSDAWPLEGSDVNSLIESTWRYREQFCAMGPTTENFGCQPLQEGHPGKREPTLTAASHLSGFVWSVSKERYMQAVDERGFFLNDSRKHKCYVVKNEAGEITGQVVNPWDGDFMDSLAMVGQETEFLLWNYSRGSPAAVCRNSYFHHDRLSRYMDPEVRRRIAECTEKLEPSVKA